MKYYSAIKIMPLAATGTDLVIIVVSEVNQKEKDKSHMISHLHMESKTQMNKSMKQKHSYRHREQTCVWQAGGRLGKG